jgi:hypothetical protein
MPTVHRIQKLVWVEVLKIPQEKIHISNQQRPLFGALVTFIFRIEPNGKSLENV